MKIIYFLNKTNDISRCRVSYNVLVRETGDRGWNFKYRKEISGSIYFQCKSLGCADGEEERYILCKELGKMAVLAHTTMLNT